MTPDPVSSEQHPAPGTEGGIKALKHGEETYITFKHGEERYSTFKHGEKRYTTFKHGEETYNTFKHGEKAAGEKVHHGL